MCDGWRNRLGLLLFNCSQIRKAASLIEAEVVVVTLVISSCDCPEVLEFIEEPLDSVTLSVKPPDEGRRIEPVRHGADIAPSTESSEAFAKGIGIICSVGQENIAGLHGVEHVGGASPVMGLAFGQFQRDGQPGGIDQGMGSWSSGRPASGPCNGIGFVFLPFVAC